jgi:hypothetical protein
MVLKNVFIAVIATVPLVWSGVVAADSYRPDQFLSLDLSKAVLSPTPLGPASRFTPGPLDVRVPGESEPTQASAQPAAEPNAVQPVAAEPHMVVHRTRVAHARVEKPRSAVRAGKWRATARAEKPHRAARTRLARRHTNPLDAEAFDTRIQVWPCRTGGICDWKR